MKFTEAQCLGCFEVLHVPGDIRETYNLKPEPECSCGCTDYDVDLVESPIEFGVRNRERSIETDTDRTRGER